MRNERNQIVGHHVYDEPWAREIILRGHRYVFCNMLEVYCDKPNSASRFKFKTPDGRIGYAECAMDHFMERDTEQGTDPNGPFDSDAFMQGKQAYYY
jgi:hypothetical protein